MRFYFNLDLNMCGSEDFVIDYIFMSGNAKDREEVRQELSTKREYFGWFECTISEDILEIIKNS